MTIVILSKIKMVLQPFFMKKNMYPGYLFLMIAVIIPSLLIAQNKAGVIYGKVLTIDNKPATYVNITLLHTKTATESDKNGAFSLSSFSFLYDTLLISGVGYESYKKAIQLNKSENVNAGTIHLRYSINELQSIEITGRINKCYKSDYSYAATKTQAAQTDIPQTVSAVTKELINDKMQLHLTNAMDNIAGVTHYSGYEEYNIRGLHAENPRLINGLRTFNTLLTSPLLVNVERIEVIKGPASVLYGNQDPGGTINIVTKKPLKERQSTFAAAAGSWNAYNMQADVTGALNKRENVLYRLNAGYENTKSFRNSLFSKSYQVAPSFTFIPNNKLQVNLDISLSHVHTVADRGQPAFKDEKSLTSTPVNLSVTQPGDYLRETTIAAALSGTYRFNNHISFNTGYLNYITSQSLSEHGIKDFITNDSVYLYYHNRQVNTITNTLTGYFTFKFNTGRLQHEILAGNDFIMTGLTASQWNGELPGVFGENKGVAGTFSLSHPQYLTRPVNSYKKAEGAADAGKEEEEGAFQTYGFYIQEQLKLNKWRLQAALRSEFYTAGEAEDGDSVTHVRKLIPSIGITYTVARNLNFYAVYNEGFDPFEPSSVVQVFNEGFKPVNSKMIELGSKTELFKKKLFASLAFYTIIINNLSVNANDSLNPDLYVQRGQQRSQGIETEMQGNLLTNLTVSTGYAFNISEISKSIKPEEVGKITENAPRHSSTSWFKYTFKNGFLNNFSMAFGHTQAGKRYTLVKDITLPAYCIFNSALYYKYKRLNFGINFNNITNKTYWASAYNNQNKWPGIPRNFMLRFNYSL